MTGFPKLRRHQPQLVDLKGLGETAADLSGRGFESSRRQTVAEIGLSEHRKPVTPLLCLLDEQSKLPLVSDLEESQIIRVPEPLAGQLGVLERELNSRVDGLAALSTRLEVSADYHVELFPYFHATFS